MTALIVRGDARRLPLPDGSVDLIVTSPPYFALRSYQDGGQHYAGQVGAEPTPAEYIDTLLDCTAEMARVLKPEGSIFVNLADKYAERAAPERPAHADSDSYVRRPAHRPRRQAYGFRPKSLMMLPERYRIGCVDQLGLIVRETLIWFKPNGMPESVTDRARRSHEDWVHLVKQPRYYSAVDEIREPHARQWTPGRNGGRDGWDRGDHLNAGLAGAAPHPLGRLPGSVWEIATEPLRVPDHLGVTHFAAFPSEWPRRLILGWSPPGICTACGEGRRPGVARSTEDDRPGRVQNRAKDALAAHGPDGRHGSRQTAVVSIAGYVCACTPRTDHPGSGQPGGAHGRYAEALTGGGYPENFGAGTGGHDNLAARPQVGPRREYHLDRWAPAPTRRAVVLDPFGGTGTTALAASVLGRVGLSVDLSADYCRLAAWRTTDPAQRAKAARRAKPSPAAAPGQDALALFAVDGGPGQ